MAASMLLVIKNYKVQSLSYFLALAPRKCVRKDMWIAETQRSLLIREKKCPEGIFGHRRPR